MGGALRHLTGFLPALAASDQESEYRVLVRESIPISVNSANISLERLPDAVAGQIGARLKHDILSLPRRLSGEGFQVVVSLTNFGPIWTSARHLLFQRNALYFHNEWLVQNGIRGRVDAQLRLHLAHEAMKRAHWIVTPSLSMARAIQRRFPKLPENKFRVLYHGFEARLLEEPLCDRLNSAFDPDSIRLLYPTHPAPHKGFEVLLGAIAELKRRGVKAKLYATFDRSETPNVVAGYEAEARRLSVSDNVVFLGHVPQNQMAGVYSACSMMVYPSLVESFGFSMLEAIACRVPIVAAATDVNREICGDAALFYPTHDSKTMADQIETALLTDQRRKLIDACASRMSAFDWGWNRYAREFKTMVCQAA